MQNRLSIRARLISIVGVILIGGFFATNIISFQVSKSTVKRSILQNELPLTSNNIYSEIQADLLQPIFISSVMSNDTLVKDWLISGEKNAASIIRYLEEIRIQYGMFTSFLVSDATKKYYHFSGISQIVSTEDPMDDWYFRFRDQGERYEINVDSNQAQEDAVTVFVNYRVSDYDGNFLGITGTGLRLDSVAKIVDRYQESFGRNVYFIDKAGAITVRSGQDAMSESNIHTVEGISEVAEEILSKDQGLYEYTRNGETMLVTTRLIPELGWYVLVEQLESVALKDLREGFVTNIIVGLVIILMTILPIAYTINNFQGKLEEMATVDELTGIGNRRTFDNSLKKFIAHHQRKKKPFAVILADIDRFKLVNDTYGHVKGDEVISHVAKTIQNHIRESDLVCRWGGEEFVVLIYECDQNQALEISEKLRVAIEASPILDTKESPSVTVSVGSTVYKEEDTTDDILARADKALYEAKGSGRNQTKLA